MGGGGGKRVYDCGKFEIVDFINFVQCKGNCLLLRSEHYLERHIGRTQYFRILKFVLAQDGNKFPLPPYAN